MKIQNISIPRKYEAKDGTVKTSWGLLGTIVTFDDGKQLIKMPHLPEDAHVFDQKKKESHDTTRDTEDVPF